MDKELVLVIDFGGQYNQLIARRVRECHVYCEILPWSTPIEKILEKKPKGIIFTGGPSIVYEEGAPRLSKEIFEAGVPILGICYGDQLTAYVLGGKVEKAQVREYGNTKLNVDSSSPLFKGIPDESACWMSHTYHISELPEGFKVIASSESCPNAAMANDKLKIYGLQFHPEVKHTEHGFKMIENFLFNICNLKGLWSMSSFAEDKIKEIKKLVGDKKVICAMSGGVDSSVAAVMIHKAIGKQLTCIFVERFIKKR
jgi:GMP synthase (glutamine-hydrolysing)